MNPRFDALVRGIVIVGVMFFLLVAMAGLAKSAEAATSPYVSEARMELVMGATETPIGAFDTVLCLGIGKHRGRALLRYAKFVCTATVYPDTLVIIRTRLSANGRLVFG